MFIKRAEYCELQVPAANTNQILYFPDLPNLRTAKVFGLEVFTSDTLTTAESQNSVVSLTNIKLAIVNLYFDQGYFIKVPAISLYRNNGTQFYFDIPQLAGQVIVWPKCYVQMVTSAAASAVSSQSFVFSVYYSLK
jgi:hypothetical protein